MSFQLSPGIVTTEIDLTTVIPVDATSVGGFVGDFPWGPANTIVTVDNENTLASVFGKPDANSYTSFFTAASFLAYGNNLKVVRALNVSSNIATSNSTIIDPSGGSCLLSWGDNISGQLGDSTTILKSSPTLIAGVGCGWCQVSSGQTFSAAIKTDGTLWTWGRNHYGQLGTNNTINRSSPGTVAGGGTNWSKISSGAGHQLALKTDGTLWTWGDNGSGKLGDETTICRSSPVTVAGGGTTWCKMSASRFQSAAIKTDGTLWTWGCGTGGSLGDNSTINRSSPGTVAGGGTTWCDISIGALTAAIKTDGTLWTWGPNIYGQLGDNSTILRSSPGTVAGGGSTWSKVQTNVGGVAALKTDGTIWTWGYGGCGGLGDETIICRSSPATIAGGATNWCKLGGGETSFYAIKSDSSLWSWGGNEAGQLGDETITNKSSPVQIGTYISTISTDSYGTGILAIDSANRGNTARFSAKYSGTIGNSFKVAFFPARDSSQFSNWQYKSFFNDAPATSLYASSKGASNDEIHIIVVDVNGTIAQGGTPAGVNAAGAVLETFPNLSVASDAKNSDGSTNYYVDVLSNQSKYIDWLAHPESATNWGTDAVNGKNYDSISYSNGVNLINGTYFSATDADKINAWNKLKNSEDVDVSLLVTGDASATVSQHVIDNIAEYRKDCVAFISPTLSNVTSSGNEVTAITAQKNTNINRSTSYAVFDSGWKYMFDKYNNVTRLIPLNGDIAGLCVTTDETRDPWFSPAGLNRGRIKNVIKLVWNPNKTQRDELYKIGVNPVVSFANEGVTLFGDKTMFSKPSGFDRINVRRLFITLEKAIATAAKYSLFEFNDEFTRSQFVALVDPFLRDVQNRRGIYDYRVVCDETNNTPEVIDRNEFIGDIYIKPARSINFIQLNFIAVRTGVEFEEIVGDV